MIEPTYIYNATLARVVDGDTYFLDLDLGLRVHAVVPIRLLHVDAFEHDSPLGKGAIIFVTKLLTGVPLLVQTKKDKQTFARWLADVWVNGELVSDLLKQAGFAKPESPWNK